MKGAPLEELRPARLELYAGAPRILRQLARVSGLQLSEGSLRNMVWASTFIGLIDHVIDRGDQPMINATMQYWSDWYAHDPPREAERPACMDVRLGASAETLRSRISGAQARSFIGAGRCAIALAEQYRTVNSPAVYARLTFDEGVAAANMYEAVILSADTHQPQFGRFAGELRLLGGLSNVLDSVYDLPRDFARNETIIASTFANRAGMLGAVCPEVIAVATNLNWRLAPLLGSAAVAFYRAWRQRRIDRQQQGPVAVVPRSH